MPALVQRLKAQDAERRAIAARLAALAAPLPAAVGAVVEERLHAAVEQWRAVLGRQVPLARQIVTKLLAEKLVFTPEPRDGRAGFRFTGTGTVEKLIAGAVPAGFLALVPSTGLNCLQIKLDRWFSADGRAA